MKKVVSLNFASWNQLERWFRDVDELRGVSNSPVNTTSGIINCDGVDRRDVQREVDTELAELPADMRARLVRISQLIESVGLPNVKEPHIRHVHGQLWEIRLKGKVGIARALYVTAKGQRVVIVRAFIKKTERTPRGEIDLALQRAKELKP